MIVSNVLGPRRSLTAGLNETLELLNLSILVRLKFDILFKILVQFMKG